jgi:transposase InsO family protein
VTPSRRRPVVSYWHDTYRVSERRACRVARLPISTFRYESRQEPRTALRLRIREIAQTRVRYGYRKIRVLLNREGWKVGKKLVYRLYREEGLALRHKPRRKRRAAMQRRERFRPTAPNQVWGVGFCGRPVGRRAALSMLNRAGRAYARVFGHRSRTEFEGRGCCYCFESDSAEARNSEAAVL